MSAIEEARRFLRPVPGVSSTLHISQQHAERMIAEHDALRSNVAEAMVCLERALEETVDRSACDLHVIVAMNVLARTAGVAEERNR